MCFFTLAELLENVTLIHKPVSLQPRGLINKGNWCYINAVSFSSAVPEAGWLHLSSSRAFDFVQLPWGLCPKV